MVIQTFTQMIFLGKKSDNTVCGVCVCASIRRAAIFGLLLKFWGRRGQNVMRQHHGKSVVKVHFNEAHLLV